MNCVVRRVLGHQNQKFHPEVYLWMNQALTLERVGAAWEEGSVVGPLGVVAEVEGVYEG